MALYGTRISGFFSNNGGGVTPPSTPKPEEIFKVSGSSFLVDGQSAKTLTDFIGLNLLFTRGGVTQYTIDNGDGTSYYTWNKTNGDFVCLPAVTTGENIGMWGI